MTTINIFLSYYFSYFNILIFSIFALSQLVILYVKKPVNVLLNLIILIIISGTQLLIYGFEFYFVLLIIVYLGGIAILFLSAVMTLNNAKPKKSKFYDLSEDEFILNEYYSNLKEMQNADLSLESDFDYQHFSVADDGILTYYHTFDLERDYPTNFVKDPSFIPELNNNFSYQIEGYHILDTSWFIKFRHKTNHYWNTLTNINFNTIIFYFACNFIFLYSILSHNFINFLLLFFFLIYIYFSKRVFFLNQIETSVFNPLRFGNLIFFYLFYNFFTLSIYISQVQLLANFFLFLTFLSIFFLNLNLSNTFKNNIEFFTRSFYPINIFIYGFFVSFCPFLLIRVEESLSNYILIGIVTYIILAFLLRSFTIFLLKKDIIIKNHFKLFYWNKKLDFFLSRYVFFCNSDLKSKLNVIIIFFLEIFRIIATFLVVFFSFSFKYLNYDLIKKITQNDLIILLNYNNELNLTTNLAENLFLNYSFMIVIITFLLLVTMVGSIMLLLEPANLNLKTQDVNFQFNKIYKKTVFLKSTN